MNISDEVLNVLARSVIAEDRVVLPPGQLERQLYEQVNRVLSAAGGKWNRKAKAHLFKQDPREALGLAIQGGKIERRKKTLQAFYTPRTLAERLVALANPKSGECILEPSCGDGSLVGALLRAEPNLRIFAFDIDELATCATRSKYLIHHIETTCFLTVDPEPTFDAVVMNPPFANDADIAHTIHAWKFVRPGGRLVSIMSPGWRSADRGRRQRFRTFVERLAGAVVDVGPGAFKESGTHVRTVMLRLDKPLDKSDEPQ